MKKPTKNKFDRLEDKITLARAEFKQRISTFQERVDVTRDESSKMTKQNELCYMEVKQANERVAKLEQQMNFLQENYSEFQSILQRSFADHQQENNKLLLEMSTTVNRHDADITELVDFKNSNYRRALEELDTYKLMAAQKFEDLTVNIINMQNNKSDNSRFEELHGYATETFEKLREHQDKNQNQILCLEHYCERYMPVQIQNMICDNMKLIHTEEIYGRLINEENKLYSRLQRQIMDMTNFGDGTIFDKIKTINEEMSRKLKLRIELRNATMLEDSEDEIVS